MPNVQGNRAARLFAQLRLSTGLAENATVTQKFDDRQHPPPDAEHDGQHGHVVADGGLFQHLIVEPSAKPPLMVVLLYAFLNVALDRAPVGGEEL